MCALLRRLPVLDQVCACKRWHELLVPAQHPRSGAHRAATCHMRQMVPAVLGDMSSAGLLNIYGLVDTQVEQNSELKTTIQVGWGGWPSGLAGFCGDKLFWLCLHVPVSTRGGWTPAMSA